MKRILILMLLFLAMIGAVSAIDTTNNNAYWGHDNNIFTDLTVYGNDETNFGTTNTNGIIGDARSFDGINDYIDGGLASYTNISSVSIWVKSPSASSWTSIKNLIGIGGSSNGNLGDFIIRGILTGDPLQLYFSDGSDYGFKNYVNILTDNQWHHFVMIGNSGDFILYVDGSLATPTSTTYRTSSGPYNFRGDSTNSLKLGRQPSGSSRFFSGEIDEVSIWSRSLSSTEVTELYNSGIGFNPYAIPDIPTPTSTINSNVQEFYNTTGISIILNTTTNTNMSYVLDGGSEISLGNNINSTTLNLTSLSEQLHNITFISNGETGEVNTTQNFTIDLTAPAIYNTIDGQEFNSYIFDTKGSVISGTSIEKMITACYDINNASCEITYSGNTYDLYNSLTPIYSYMDTWNNYQNFTSTLNGNISYTITATDLAGNQVQETGSVFINPYQYFRFSDGSFLTDYTFGDILWDTEYASFKTYDLGLGNTTFTFSKLGYITTDFTFNINTTSAINTTYSTTDASITINIRDKSTGDIVTGPNFNLEFISDIGFSTTTTTGTVTLTGTFMTPDSFRVIITNVDYISESIFFDYDAREALEINAYVLPINNTNLGYVEINVKDLAGNNVDGAFVYAKQWDSTASSFVTVTEGKTASDGSVKMYILLEDKVYKFSAVNGEYVAETSDMIIAGTDNGKIITLTLDRVITARPDIMKDLTYTVTESFNELTNISLVTVNWNSVTGNPVTLCIDKYRYIFGSEKLLDSECFTGVAETKYKAYYINSSQDINLKVEYQTIDNRLITLKTIKYNSNSNPVKIFENLGLSILLVPLLFLVAISIGLASKNIFIGSILMIIMAGISLTLAPSILTGGVVAFCGFIGIMTLMGANRE